MSKYTTFKWRPGKVQTMVEYIRRMSIPGEVGYKSLKRAIEGPPKCELKGEYPFWEYLLSNKSFINEYIKWRMK